MSSLSTLRLPARDQRNRHDHTVGRFTSDQSRLVAFEQLGVDQHGAVTAAAYVAHAHGVVPPTLTFHRGRSAHTGYCMAPRPVAIAASGAAAVEAWELQRERRWPEEGMIRLGAPSSLATVAHELGHHLVHVLDPVKTPNHGKVWVSRFDSAAAAIALLLAESPPAADVWERP